MSRDRDDPFDAEPPASRGPGRGALTAIVVLLACAGGWLAWDRLQHAPVALTAARGRLTLAEEVGEQPVFDPRESPEIWYRVVLTEAPLGSPARLVGEWLDPAGRVVRRNTYDTKPITHLPWETHVRFRLPTDAPPGRWRVRLLSDGRELHSLPFEVGAGDAAKGGGP